MFAMGTDRLLPQARELVNEVAATLRTMHNPLIVRGHTDGLPYSAGQTMNYWMLSSARAEATRMSMADNGIRTDRFARSEGLAHRDPFPKGDVTDPRHRPTSIPQ